METAPLISIISVNYKKTEVTCEFLRSLRLLTYPNFEVIIVDNASDEDPTSQINQVYPEAQLILSDTNLGFAGGNNLGIQQAKGDYCFLVNNDTEVTPDLLEQLLKPFQQYKEVGMVSPKIKFYDHPRVIQYAGFTTINPFTGRNRVIGGRETDNGQFDDTYETAYAHGAAMMVSKRAIEQVGLIPEEFFLCYEELDWSIQMSRAGYRIYYTGSGTIYHKESMTMGKDSPTKTYYMFRNRILFMRRNFGGLPLLVFYLFFLLISLPKTILNALVRRRKSHLASLYKAVMWHFKTRGTQLTPAVTTTAL